MKIPPDEYMTLAQAAVWHGKHKYIFRDMIRHNPDRFHALFPGAIKEHEGVPGKERWILPVAEVSAWNPPPRGVRHDHWTNKQLEKESEIGQPIT